MPSKRWVPIPIGLIAAVIALALTVGLAQGGCAAREVRSEAWAGGPEDGRKIETEHYILHTTIVENGFLEELTRTMEDSYALYVSLAPLSRSPAKLNAFVYAYRDEWAEYTQATAGPLAPVYLQIQRGGYAHEDIFATFYHGRPQTLAVCRHEGWHQYVATGFERRLPPFLEEGIATLFEAGFEQGDFADPMPNGVRQLRLIEAVRQRRAWPLRTLLAMHSGDVIGSDGAQIDTFYAQAWALARFLLQSDRYRDGFLRMLAGYADGSVGSRSPTAAMEHFLDAPFESIERDYQKFVLRLTGLDPAAAMRED